MKVKCACQRAAALLCVAALLATLIPSVWAADAFLWVGSASTTPGETRSVYVNGSNLNALAGVGGIVSYDATALELTGATMLGDMAALGSVNTKTDGQVSFGGVCLDGISGNKNILRLDLRVKEGAAPGEYLISVLVNEAYDSNGIDVSLTGVPGVFTVAEPQPVTKTLYFYGRSDVSVLHKDDSVKIIARISDSQGLAAGKMEFRYDAALFTCVAAEPLSALSEAMKTLDTSRKGYVSATFAAEDAIPGGDLLQLTLKASADVDTTTSITFTASDLYDTSLAAISGIGFTQELALRKTEVAEEPPSLRIVVPETCGTNEKLMATVVVDGSSALAAGDFKITYDVEKLACLEVGPGPGIKNEDGVYIMTKPTIDGGEIGFTFICQTGIASDMVLLTVAFQPKQETVIELTPSVTSTPVTADHTPITLEMRGAVCTIKDPFFSVSFWNEDGTLLSQQSVRYRTAAEPPQASKAPDTDHHYTFTGWNGDHSSITADVDFTAQYKSAAHTVVVDDAVQPTCTEPGATEGKHCSVCDFVLVKQKKLEAAGHTEVIDAAEAPTYAKSGLTEGKHCSTCNTVLLQQEVIEALGFTISGTVKGSIDNAAVSLMKGETVMARGTVQDGGEFRLSPVRVDAGDYILRVDGSGCVPWELPVTLSDDCGNVSEDCLLTRIGDVNGDGTGAEDALHCALDLQTLYEYLSLRRYPDAFCGITDFETNALYEGYFLRVADVNGDGVVNILDYQRLYTLMRAGR